MTWFPQIGLGSVSQFPLKRVRRWRNIENDLEGGERLSLPDASSRRVEWSMKWRDLSDSEVANLQSHFLTVAGSFAPFGFVDPMANLIAWSEDLSKPDWEPGLLTCTGGVGDPFGLQGAWTVTNSAAGEQSLTQQVAIPGSYVGCFSLWLRADAATHVSLQRDGTRSACAVGGDWKRAYISGAGSAASSSFALVLEAGVTVQACGFQVDAQPYPSQYKRTRAPRGIYHETRFAQQELSMTSTAPGLTACDIALVSRV